MDLFTGGFVCSKDSLASGDDLLSNVTELLLLLGSEEGICVRHPDSVAKRTRQKTGETLGNICQTDS